MNKNVKPTYIDLFSGIGGFRVGMDHAGFQHLYSNDWDKYARQTYETNQLDIALNTHCPPYNRSLIFF